jgi:hypothetical protein
MARFKQIAPETATGKAKELLDAVDAVCQGRLFFGPRLSGSTGIDSAQAASPGRDQPEGAPSLVPGKER